MTELKPVSVLEIVERYLIDGGYDGLLHEDSECGCHLPDIAPCGYDDFINCEPAYKVPCTCGEGCDFDMYRKKQSAMRNNRAKETE